jgi:hypothetical protein
MLIDTSGRLLGKINLIDFAGILTVLLIVAGTLLVQSGMYKTSGQIIQGEEDIDYTVSLRGVQTLSPNLFSPGKLLSITIRNQPRGNVKILKVTQGRTQEFIPLPNGTARIMDHPVETNAYNYLVTLHDHALKTPDGYVTEGVKVKIGLQIEVEGFNYRLHGQIVDVAKSAPATKKVANSSV